ncbi:hypothetical protein L596_003195 [Steinernema carpocapsae]|uniref:Uncharacterized protein n=1 Tax=Steinernema carpocapsae TaxID=34508 RepID=A0A4U8UTE0_STECR|nr:hypothetical protein L596_003195 [Steinernema carpocapsae]
MLRLSLVCLLSLLALSVRSTSEKIPPSVEKPPRVLELKDIWPDGDYCILKGPSACPPNFEKHRTRLSVQQIFTTEEKRRDGSMAISTGTFGESGLTSDSYDDLYSLDLVTCCRIPS